MFISSTGIIDGIIKKDYGGRGTYFNENNVPTYSLPFKIEEIPENTVSFAFILEDKDAYPVVGFTWIHWLGANLKRNEVKENETAKLAADSDKKQLILYKVLIAG